MESCKEIRFKMPNFAKESIKKNGSAHFLVNDESNDAHYQISIISGIFTKNGNDVYFIRAL